MNYAIIRTGGKQFAVEEGQTLRVPSIEGKEGDSIEMETLACRRRQRRKIWRRRDDQRDHQRTRTRRKNYRFQEKTPQTIQTQTRSSAELHGNYDR